jgi:Nitrous oxide-stimulated promoter
MTGHCGSIADGAEFVRRAREFKTMIIMLRMYCRTHHHTEAGTLCQDCCELHDYARRRIERCVFGEAKPTCANCSVHCYKALVRDRVKQVMRWAGPRMFWRHPVLTVWHVIDGSRPAPIIRRPDSAGVAGHACHVTPIIAPFQP